MGRDRRVLQCLLFALLVLGWTAPAAQAGTFSVTYEVTAGGSCGEFDPDGQIVPPAACTETPGGTITVSGTATRSPGPFPGSFYGTLAPTALNVNITGAPASWSATLDAVGAGVFALNIAGTAVDGFAWSAFPVTPLFVNPVYAPGGSLLPYNGYGGPGVFEGTGFFAGGSITATARAPFFPQFPTVATGFKVTGQETMRTFTGVPEPGTGLLLGAGLVAFAAFGHSRGRQRRN